MTKPVEAHIAAYPEVIALRIVAAARITNSRWTVF